MICSSAVPSLSVCSPSSEHVLSPESSLITGESPQTSGKLYSSEHEHHEHIDGQPEIATPSGAIWKQYLRKGLLARPRMSKESRNTTTHHTKRDTRHSKHDVRENHRSNTK